ncbi:hypothetical protein [uncultured Gimesia sp.]|uniref:hypothetical protein n=1 Tax=uncultured Gimesia sp. TaxID=1678688 RepID=UPI00262E1102|nr:hypothetical protein [uncultured Gimesia sp.]
MSASIHLYLSGNHNESSQSLTELSNLSISRLNDLDLTHLRRDELVSLIERTTSDYLGVVDSQQYVDLSELNQLNNLNLNADQNEIYLLPFDDSGLFIQLMECLPPVAASLAMNPLQHALVLIPKSAFSKLQEIPDSADLLWHILILLAQAGMKSRSFSSTEFPLSSTLQPPLPDLAPNPPGPARDWLLHILRAYQPAQDLPSISSPADAAAMQSGLLCLHDYLDESHQFSQSVQNQGLHQAGDYWHHIMHRREPDYSNAKYWSRVVGYHPIHDLLPERVRPLIDLFETQTVANWKNRLLLNNRWSLNTFVDCCSECESSQDRELIQFARRVQWIEMLLLLQKTSLDTTTG